MASIDVDEAHALGDRRSRSSAHASGVGRVRLGRGVREDREAKAPGTPSPSRAFANGATERGDDGRVERRGDRQPLNLHARARRSGARPPRWPGSRRRSRPAAGRCGSATSDLGRVSAEDRLDLFDRRGHGGHPAGAAPSRGARHQLASLPRDAKEARAIDQRRPRRAPTPRRSCAPRRSPAYADRVEQRELRRAHRADGRLGPLGGPELLLGRLAIGVREDRAREDDLDEAPALRRLGAPPRRPKRLAPRRRPSRGRRPSTRTGCPDRRRRTRCLPSAACSEKKIAPGTANVGPCSVSIDLAACFKAALQLVAVGRDDREPRRRPTEANRC